MIIVIVNFSTAEHIILPCSYLTIVGNVWAALLFGDNGFVYDGCIIVMKLSNVRNFLKLVESEVTFTMTRDFIMLKCVLYISIKTICNTS